MVPIPFYSDKQNEIIFNGKAMWFNLFNPKSKPRLRSFHLNFDEDLKAKLLCVAHNVVPLCEINKQIAFIKLFGKFSDEMLQII